MREKWVDAGTINVDAGLVVIADPCRFTGTESLTGSWPGFVERAGIRGAKHMANIDGLAVVAATYHGDGLYPVRVRHNDDGWIVGIRIDFD
jgi:hypothetical protein